MLRALPFILLSLTPVLANADDGQSYKPALASEAEMPCVNRKPIGSQDVANPKPVTLTDIKAVPSLADNLKTFFDNQDLNEGVTFTSTLGGKRIDPGQCWSLLSPVIDIMKCSAVKPAGENKLVVKDGMMKIFVDAGPGSPQIPVPLWSICSDGKKTLRFKFLYMKNFGPVQAGPWEYTVEVTNNGNSKTSLTKVREVYTGRTRTINVGENKVTKFEARGENPQKTASDSNRAPVPTLN